MNVYKIEKNKIVEIKNVSDVYNLQSNEFQGISPGKIGQVLIDEVWQYDPKEIAEAEKQNRIVELEILIDQKVRLGDDVQELRSEYRALLGL